MGVVSKELTPEAEKLIEAALAWKDYYGQTEHKIETIRELGRAADAYRASLQRWRVRDCGPSVGPRYEVLCDNGPSARFHAVTDAQEFVNMKNAAERAAGGTP
jgi:hypothetical protein